METKYIWLLLWQEKKMQKKDKKNTPKSSLWEDLITNLKAYVEGVEGGKSLLKHFQLEGKHSLNFHIDETLFTLGYKTSDFRYLSVWHIQILLLFIKMSNEGTALL